MAWGLWNKIKQGFKKAGKVIKQGAKFVSDNVIKPFKPVISGVATAFNPTVGAAVTKGMNAVERFSDEGWTDTGKRAVGWAQSALSGKGSGDWS